MISSLVVLTSVVAVTAAVVTAGIGASASIAAGVGTAAGCSTIAAVGLRLERGVVGLLEDHVLDERLRDDILLHDLALRVRVLSDDDTLALGLEQHAARGDGGCTAVVLLHSADGAEAHLEDADAVELHLLAQLEEVLHRAAELVEDGLDVALLDAGLCLDELGQFLGLDEMLVVDRRGEPLAVGCGIVVLVL